MRPSVSVKEESCFAQLIRGPRSFRPVLTLAALSGASLSSRWELPSHWRCASDSALAAPVKGGAANIAMIGEPQTLDPMASTADLVGIITQHIYELLYTFDANWNVTPMLAESMPAISKDGLVYTIPLRKGVKFHNGKEMTSDDVVASLKRWMDTAPRGKAVAKEIKSLEAKGSNSIVITLNRPMRHCWRTWRCRTVSRRSCRRRRSPRRSPNTSAPGLTSSRSASPTSTCSWCATTATARARNRRAATRGHREAWIDELRFIPVPNANTRVEGSLSGQYQFADLLPVESYARIENAPNVKPVLTSPFGFPYLVLNTKQGPLANLALRQAVEAALNNADMMGAGFGDPKFYTTEAQPLRQEHAVLFDRRHRELRQGRREEGGGAGRDAPSTTARRSRFSPASSTTSTIAWRW